MEQKAAQVTKMHPAKGYAAMKKGGPIVPWAFERRDVRPQDVALKILFCGICHSDVHSVDKWGNEFPLVPGHELMGEVTNVGSEVTRFAIGDKVLVGTIVDSCRVCDHCKAEMEPYCREFPTLTYDGTDCIDKTRTRGGYSDHYVADQRFVYHVPEGLDPASCAPLLCAGITTYSPLKHWKVGPGMVVGIIGIGGLGHLAVKFARAMGAHVVAFTTSAHKVDLALDLGAHEVILSSDETQMASQTQRFDFILDTVSQSYPMNPFLNALKLDATLCSLGIPDAFDFKPVILTLGRRNLSSSGVGGTLDTREMLDFCKTHGIVADIEIVAPSAINEAFARLQKGDIRYRFVIDMNL